MKNFTILLTGATLLAAPCSAKPSSEAAYTRRVKTLLQSTVSSFEGLDNHANRLYEYPRYAPSKKYLLANALRPLPELKRLRSISPVPRSMKATDTEVIAFSQSLESALQSLSVFARYGSAKDYAAYKQAGERAMTHFNKITPALSASGKKTVD